MRLSVLRAFLLIALVVLLPDFLAAQNTTYQTAQPTMKPKKREIYFYGMRAYPFDKIPQNARLEALLHTDSKMKPFRHGSHGMLSANQWKAIGPFDLGGRVRSVVAHPTDGNTVWIGAADGGVWKSSDRGENWVPLMDDANAISMGALAVDPRNPDILYAGTGEMSSNVDSYTGAGIMKTTNGGGTWRPVGLTNVGAFSRIIVHPGNSNLVFAGATKNNGGFYRSTDGGNTWSRTFEEAVSDVTVDPQNQNRVWIGTMANGVYRSDDGGQTFTEKNFDLGLPGYDKARISVQCAPSSPNILYALVYETSGSGNNQSHFSRIFKSTDAGDTWTIVFNNTWNFLNSTGVAQGWYNNVIVVSPSDPNLVIAGGIDLVRTTNGGTNWQFIDTYGASSAPHPDQHALAFDPTSPQRLYLGNDGGMYRSETGGQFYLKKSKGLAITQFYAMGIDQKHPTKTYGGTQDNGTISTTSTNYGDVLGGDGFYVVVDPEESNTIYAEQPNGRMYRINLSNGARTLIMRGIDSDDEAAWSAPLVPDPNRPGALWHGRHYVYATLDRGDFWIQTTARFNGLVSAIGISPLNSNIVYAGSDRGEVQMTETGGGGTWMDRSTAPGVPNRAVTDLIASSRDENTVFMSVSGFFTGHVFKSTDRGASWTDISNGLPDIPVNALALHPDDENIIYAGTDIGVYITIDGGRTWASYNQGLPRVAVADLSVHRQSGTLRMASHGRSMWEIGLERPAFPVAIVSPSGGEVWMGGSSQIVSWSGFTEGAPLKLEFSLDDGERWGLLAENLAGTTFRWNVFDTSVIAARLRVTNMSDPNQSAVSRSFTVTKFTLGGVLDAGQVSTIPYGLAHDGDFLWATDFGSTRLLKLDRDNLTTMAIIPLAVTPGDSMFTDITYHPGKGTFFVHKLINTVDTDPGGFLFEVNKSGQQVNRWQSPCLYPTGLVYAPAIDGEPEQFIATDRNNTQNIFYLDANNPSVRLRTVQRDRRVKYGPRGATLGPDGKTIYQAITDFTGDILQTSTAEKLVITNQSLACTFPLTSPITSGYINVRGIELDPRDSNLWVSDYSGNIYKVISCDGSSRAVPPPSLSVPYAPVPAGMTLLPNVPNPFASSTRIPFTLPFATDVQLHVYNVNGRQVATLANGRYEGGSHAVEFDPSGLPSGVYRYSLSIGNGAMLTRTMIYIR